MPSITDALRARGIGSGQGISQTDLTALIDVTNTAEVNNDAIKLDVVNKLNAMNPALNLTTAASWSTIRAVIGSMSYKGAVTITPGPTDQPIPAGYHSGGGKVSAVTVPVASVLTGTTIAGQTGTMPNRGAVTITPGRYDQTIQAGYHNGAGVVKGVYVPTNYLVEGNTVAGQAGTLKDLSRDRLTALLGENAWAQALSAKGNGQGHIVLEPETAYYTSGKTSTGYGSISSHDPNFIPSNILSGKSIFGVVGTAGGWKVANGYSNGGTTTTMNYQDRDGYLVPYYTYQVNQSFGFTPKIIILWRNDREEQETVFVDKSIRGLSTSYLKAGNSDVDCEWAQSYSYVYANTGGFQLPVYYSPTYYHWVAIGN